MKTTTTKILAAFTLLLICAADDAIAQNIFPSTGRAGIYTTAPAASLQVRGGARMGTTANYLSVDSATGNLSFVGTSAYRVAGNKYAFQYSGNPNYGLYFNSTDVQYEFRNGSAVPVFYVNANTGNGVFSGNVKIGAYTLPVTDGTNGQLLRTDGAGNVSWATVPAGGGANTALSNLAATAINVSLLPGTDNTRDMGSALFSWKNLYLKGSLYFNGIKMMRYKAGINTLIGENAGSNGTGGFNTAIGSNVLSINTTGNSNVAIGENSLVYNTTGSNNTAAGYAALINNTTGSDNTANGFQALYNNTTGVANTAVGKFSLFANTTANENTATGYYSLYANTTGIGNAAFGSYALQENATGNNNTATGNSALYANVTGTDNTANGFGALSANNTGILNTAIGKSALSSNTTGSYNTAAGGNSLKLNISGNSNTALGYGAIYSNTTGGNNTAIGTIALYSNTTGSFNTATGNLALNSNTTGYNNTAHGSSALSANTIGNDNSAFGLGALSSNKIGNRNTGIGESSLFSNTANDNTALGYNSLYANTTGYSNTASGVSTLTNNIGGYGNTANGHYALFYNTYGFHNTANGYGALFNNTDGQYNTADGSSALFYNTTGINNTAIGGYTLIGTTTGFQNTAVGYNALWGNVSGYDNIGIGVGSHVTAGNLNNAIVIGRDAIVDGSNKVRIGNTDITSIGGQVGWSTFSDGRYKKNIKQDVKGLVFINSLQPITYTVDVNNLNAFYDKNGKQDSSHIKTKTYMQESADKASKIIYNGFIAQDVEKAAEKLNYSFSGVDKPQSKDGLYGLRYADFVVPLVKAVQELDKKTQEIDELKTEVEELKKLVQSLVQTKSSTVNNSLLEQNIPNPFNQSTSINYTLPAKFSSAKIIVTDNNGKTMKQFTISSAGKGSVSIAAGSLASGLYHYALYVDGKMADSKKMEIIR